jgi:hypothetical protein
MRPIAVIAIVAVVAVAGVAGFFALYPPGTNISTSSSLTGGAAATQTNSSSVSQGAQWQVVKKSVTVYYGVANIPCGVVVPTSCMTVNTEAHSPSLNVSLIKYQGNYYYASNYTTFWNAQPRAATIWFTNSSIFCVSPSLGRYSPCPASPAHSQVVIEVAGRGGSASASSTNSTSADGISTAHAGGLRLDLTIVANQTFGGVTVSVDEYNPLTHPVNLSVGSGWPVSPPSELRDTCSSNYIAAFAIYKGNYDAKNFTSATPLALDSPQAFGICPSPSPGASFSFAAESSHVSISPGNPPFTFAKFANASITDNIVGYYTGTRYQAQFNQFDPSMYTLIAMDGWGQIALLHFDVKG